MNEYGEPADDPRDDDANWCTHVGSCCYWEPERRWQDGDVAGSRTSAWWVTLIDGRWTHADGRHANVTDAGDVLNASEYADKHEMVLVLRDGVHPRRTHKIEGRPKSRYGNPYELWWTDEWEEGQS